LVRTKYRHYKGGLYTFIAKAKCSETLQDLVVYQSDGDGDVWVRPLKEFASRVEVDGELKPRFERLKESSAY
jgi:hypothetical protein